MDKFFEKLFSLDKFKFSKIKVKKEVILGMIEFARANYPKEFMALLGGEIRENSLIITKIIYQPFRKSKTSASIIMNPNIYHIFGSVHSHPSLINRPSKTDLMQFNKRGVAHFIINFPYQIKNILCYNNKGEVIDYEII
jgi:proteasome lid subunit RPN8/RPN11